ncbi:helix-turn-helix domain-containing protein, partial [Akkermansiaceae bacterium]|nr:helix-turn-helix domain-containing protein [Akkermansiaceae bacterium]
MAGVNQQEIADRLGLSKATVSRCFTNHAGISAVTRAKVFQLAAELGYTHLESRSIKVRKKAKKQPTNFTVLICSDTDEY